ncbi:MAG: TonB-dependent receptor [Steroidobacteraceae bacterium]
MAKPLTCAGMLLVANMLTLPAAIAQVLAAEQANAAAQTAEAPAPAAAAAEAEAPVEVSAPGGEIIVLGRRDSNIERATTQVISLLSNEDIARTGEGDIAGALGRVTGLSVVGGGFVYVRGLGDRYSQALLNGSPLPSPEPLRRAVPLDLFPTDVIASSLVQKTYSANFPGEFGGGVINLTTLATPRMPFLNFSFGVSGDSESSGSVGYTHYGNRTDWTGYDSGNRDLPSALQAFVASGERLSAGNVDSGEIAKQFVDANNALVQRNDKIPANYSMSTTGGTSWVFDDSELGLIATAGFSNKWRTRDNIEQTPGSFDLSAIDKDYHSIATENHAVMNALLGIGYEFGDGNKLRWTNLYVHDTLKRTSLAEGRQNNQRFGADFLEQNTGWYERQLVDTQLTGDFKLEPVTISARASYARSSRKAPFELGLGYVRTNLAASPYGGYFINRLDNGQSGFAQAAFSDLKENLWSAGVDVTGRAWHDVVLTAGLDFTETKRDSTRREFQIIAPSSFPSAIGLLRPDYLLAPKVIEDYNIGLIETTESDPAFAAELQTKAGYVQAQAEIAAGLEINAGARLERGTQSVRAKQVFATANASNASTLLEEDYVLPAATLTYKFSDNMQVRFNGSTTIARPQFRELIFQAYFDPESNRAYRGNPLLVDSQFVNAEARYEWYFAPEQQFSIAGFYKTIDKPIEAFTGFNDNSPVTSFANAPSASLYGIETDVQKFFPLDVMTDWGSLASRRLVLVGNYTFTNSKIKVGAGDTVSVFGTTIQPATNFFVDGAPLTGQSDHLVNLQIGLEDTQALSQQTLLLSYASDRVTSRGPAGLPDIYESPGFILDFVARQGLTVFGTELEVKFEARNLLRHGYKEFQERGGNTVYYNRYAVGTSVSASVSAKF